MNKWILSGYKGDGPYNDNYEYISDIFLFAALNCLNYIERNKKQLFNEAENTALKRGGYDYNEVVGFLQEKTSYVAGQELPDLTKIENSIIERRKMSESRGMTFSIEILFQKLKLNYTAKYMLVLAVMAAVDWEYKQVFRFLLNDGSILYPTVGLCARIFGSNDGSGELKIYGEIQNYLTEIQILFPEITTQEPLYMQKLYCDCRLVKLLLENEPLTDGEEQPEPMFFRDKETELLWELVVRSPKCPVFFINGARGIGKKLLITNFAKQNKSNIVFFKLNEYAGLEQYRINDIIQPLYYSVRECVLRTRPLAITGMEVLNRVQRDELICWINNHIREIVGLIFLLSDDEEYKQSPENVYHIYLPNLDELQRAELWKYYLSPYVMEDCFKLEALANTFVITPGQMINAIEQAAAGTVDSKIFEKEMYRACYSQIDHKLAKKAAKVKPSFKWDDLKMPREDKEILRDVCCCIKNRHVVMNEWNFKEVVPYGAGITILFAGPPGTGKTMAAQVTAGTLNMELYKIDLSQMMDKYVGETEKNIKEIFEQAKKSNSILFFDEADSIFGKRIEAASANDRFANIESSMLLQCIEEYNGVTILATNNYSAMDSAFIRRFKFYIPFHAPNAALRCEIWKSVFPKEAPIRSDIDFELLAELFDFTGAVIKNIALSAAYLAAEQKHPITTFDILKSVKREMTKNNLVLSKEKLGDLMYLYDEIFESEQVD